MIRRHIENMTVGGAAAILFSDPCRVRLRALSKRRTGQDSIQKLKRFLCASKSFDPQLRHGYPLEKSTEQTGLCLQGLVITNAAFVQFLTEGGRAKDAGTFWVTDLR